MDRETSSIVPSNRSRRFFGRLLRRYLDIFAYLVRLAMLAYRAMASIFWEGGRGRGLFLQTALQQVYFTAVQATPLLLFVAVASGALVMIRASVDLPNFGMTEVEGMATLVLLKGLAPLVVILVVIARSANAIVIEIGNMKVNGEIRSLQMLGINLDRFIVLPRIVGMILSVITLTAMFCAAALWGGYALADITGELESNFVLSRLVAAFDLDMFFNVLVRAVFFGIIVGTVSCYHGLRVHVSPTEVPQQASRGVVSSLSLCFVLNFLVLVFAKFE